jgi:hypothetical protein
VADPTGAAVSHERQLALLDPQVARHVPNPAEGWPAAVYGNDLEMVEALWLT